MRRAPTPRAGVEGGRPMSAKKGTDFEAVVAWIHEALRERGVVTPNAKLRDRHTGRSRQIDVAIRVVDGPVEFLAIVEVRDRSRPVGVPFVEEVRTRMESVGAHAAYIVSKSGFQASARIKAASLGIRLFTFEEAKHGDWTAWIVHVPDFHFVDQKEGTSPVIALFSADGQLINLHPDVLASQQVDPRAPILLDAEATPVGSLADLAVAMRPKNGHPLWDQVPEDGSRVQCTVKHVGEFVPPLFVRRVEGALIQVGGVIIENEYWKEVRTVPFRLHRYKAGSGEVEAEVVSAKLDIEGKPHTFEILKRGGEPYIKGGDSLLLRHRVDE